MVRPLPWAEGRTGTEFLGGPGGAGASKRRACRESTTDALRQATEGSSMQPVAVARSSAGCPGRGVVEGHVLPHPSAPAGGRWTSLATRPSK